MKIVQLITDNREHHRKYDLSVPYFGTAPEALLQGFSKLSELEVHVVSCTQQPMENPMKLAENIWFHSLHVPKIGWLRTGYQGCIRAIRRQLLEIRPDVVHGQGTERECALGAAFSGFPNVVTIHGNMTAIAKLFHARIGTYLWCAALLERFTLSRVKGVFCNSAYTESMVQPFARRTFRVPNALRLEFFDTPLPIPAGTSKPILLNIGVISPRKRQLELLELAEELHKAGNAFELQFVGTTDPREKYGAAFLQRMETAERQGFGRYLGNKSLAELIVLLDTASALIHIPTEEAFGLVVAEALARNLKLFATNVGGITEIADGIEGAELFPVENGQGLRHAITHWLKADCPRPQTAASTMRARYHPELVAARHVAIYRKLLKLPAN